VCVCYKVVCKQKQDTKLLHFIISIFLPNVGFYDDAIVVVTVFILFTYGLFVASIVNKISKILTISFGFFFLLKFSHVGLAIRGSRVRVQIPQ
jgi:hypothetical protein